MTEPDMAERKAAIEAKYADGAPWTREDRVIWWAGRCIELNREMARLKPQVAHELVLKELAATSIAHAMRRQEIEARLAVVEAVLAGQKPRVKVPARSRPL